MFSYAGLNSLTHFLCFRMSLPKTTSNMALAATLFLRILLSLGRLENTILPQVKSALTLVVFKAEKRSSIHFQTLAEKDNKLIQKIISGPQLLELKMQLKTGLRI